MKLIESIKKSIAAGVYNLLQRRQARRTEAQNLKEAQRLLQRRQKVMGPDTPDAVALWAKIMGKSPSAKVKEIYSDASNSWAGVAYRISFTYDTPLVLVNTLSDTPWKRASRLLSDNCYRDFVAPPPFWCPHWPIEPNGDAKSGGVESSTVLFGSDYFYYYLDIKNKRFFLATGMTSSEKLAHIENELSRHGYTPEQIREHLRED